MYSQDRVQLRKIYTEAWRKAKAHELMSPMEALIADILALHPEYHAYVDDEASLDQDFPAHAGIANPFLHLSLHVAVREQMAAQQPPGLREIYEQLCHCLQDPHEAEHALMDHLMAMVWESSQGKPAPEPSAYVAELKQHLAAQGFQL